MSRRQTPELPYSPRLTGELVAMEGNIDAALVAVKSSNLRTNLAGDLAEEKVRELWEDGIIDSVSQFEACLREIGSKVHCIGVPAAEYGGGFPTWKPSDPDADSKYTLVIAYGATENSQLLQQWEMDAAENARRLDDTGLLRTSL